MTTSSSTPSPAITSRLIPNGMRSFGRASGRNPPRRARLELVRGHEPERLLQRQHALGVGILEAERPDPGSLELLAVGVSQPGHQLADVGARGAFDLEPRAVALPPEELEAVNRDRPGLALDWIPAARAPVQPLAADLDGGVRRRPLHQLPGWDFDRLGHAPSMSECAIPVPCAGGPAKARHRAVGLRQAHQEALYPRRAPDQEEQKAGGERIERAGVPDL